MSTQENTPNINGGREPHPNLYFFDGTWRRELHRFGKRQIDIYAEEFKRMDIWRTDSVVDVGAGMGDDARHVAQNYKPRVIYMVEPKIEELENSDDKFYFLELSLAEKGLEHVVLLPSITSRNFNPIPDKGVPEEELTYLSPIAGVAEDLPFPDRSISRLWANHSVYEYHDLERAVGEFARVLGPDGIGSAITNGPNDKLKFKELLTAANQFFGSEVSTVSSKVDYHALTEVLSRYFPFIKVMVYKDEMKINSPKRQAFYMTSWHSYRRSFNVTTAEWLEFTKNNIEDTVHRNDFTDSIDIAAIFFSHNKDALSHIEGGDIFYI